MTRTLCTIPLIAGNFRKKPRFDIRGYEAYSLDGRVPRDLFEQRVKEIHQFTELNFPSVRRDYYIISGGLFVIIGVALLILFSIFPMQVHFLVFAPPCLLFLYYYYRRHVLFERLQQFETELSILLQQFTLQDAVPHAVAWFTRRIPGSVMSIMYTSIPRWAVEIAEVEPDDYMENLPAYCPVDPLMPPPPAYMEGRREETELQVIRRPSDVEHGGPRAHEIALPSPVVVVESPPDFSSEARSPREEENRTPEEPRERISMDRIITR
ncbi:uncharacterized protein VTP21DRAFT_5154 [Calcarisporiella thermophila]|uniref:uncharacterized protein n=1 Tax=Calcarisporiella thermophila TaxID=911321 RepID=UPI0037424D96